MNWAEGFAVGAAALATAWAFRSLLRAMMGLKP